MNQTSLYVSHCEVGLFHKPFPPPVFLKGINPNPPHPSNPSRSCCFVRVHLIPPSGDPYLAYNVRSSMSLYLTTVSRGLYSQYSSTPSLNTPADNYNNIFIESQNYNESYIESYKKSVTFGSMAVYQFGC